MKRPEKPDMPQFWRTEVDYQSYLVYLSKKKELPQSSPPQEGFSWGVIDIFKISGAFVLLLLLYLVGCFVPLSLISSLIAWLVGAEARGEFRDAIWITLYVIIPVGLVWKARRGSKQERQIKKELENFELNNQELIVACEKWRAIEKAYTEDKAKWEEHQRQKELRAARKKKNYWVKMDGLKSEKEFASLLRKNGFNAKATKASGDEGIDIVGKTLDGEPLVVQCKAWKAPVPAPT
jgi:hypothetical protein